LFEKVRVGEIVKDFIGGLHLIVDIESEGEYSISRPAVRTMKAYYASKLPPPLQTQVRQILDRQGLHIRMDMILAIEPINSTACVWDPKSYKLVPRDQLACKIGLQWSPATNASQTEPVLLFQFSSESGCIELVNVRPFEHNYKRWQPINQNSDAPLPLHFQLYADGFRTWLSRSGHVVAVYMSLSQLPIDVNRKTLIW
jgi:hypothetical protein